MSELDDLVNELCSVCGESVFFQNNSPVKIKCGHHFHKSCLNQWCKVGNRFKNCSCPLCKNKFDYKADKKNLKSETSQKIKAASQKQIDDIRFTHLYSQSDIQQIRENIDSMRTRSLSFSQSSESSPKVPNIHDPRNIRATEINRNQPNIHNNDIARGIQPNIHDNDIARGIRPASSHTRKKSKSKSNSKSKSRSISKSRSRSKSISSSNSNNNGNK